MNIVLPTLLLLWSGMIIGLSFIATPIKFQAPHLDLAVALEVGKVTFQMFHKIEWFMAIASLFAVWLLPSCHVYRLLIMFVCILLLVQSIWLLPELALRADTLMQGTALKASPHHWFYIFFEGTKFLLLLAIGIRILYRLGANG